jgi:polysaccharide pyruvyl transferase WcaK-like protein
LTLTHEQEFLAAAEPEAIFLHHLRMLLRAERPAERRSSQRPFRPLLMGYNGAGNVGSDVRVAEIIRQFRKIFAHTGFDPGLVIIDRMTEPYFADLRPVVRDCYAPDFLAREVPRYDAVIACEGSMFTSTFSDTMASGLVAAVAYAHRLGRPGIAYGADGGTMSPELSDFVFEACRDNLLLCRNEETRAMLAAGGLNAQSGADSAWTFEPSGVDARAMLSAVGWDGRAPVIALCPVNPFWWPARVDFEKARAFQAEGRFADLHTRSVFFLSWSDERAAKYDAYLAALAKTIDALRQGGGFPIMIAMDRLDRGACDALATRLSTPIPQFIGLEHGMNATVALIRQAALLISSRFHGTLFAIAGGVPVIGVTMDSRIRALFAEHGLAQWMLECDAPQLGDRLVSLSEQLLQTGDDVRSPYHQILASQIKAFGGMGLALLAELAAGYPDLPVSPLAPTWDAHLPALSPRLQRIMSDYT